MASFCPVTLFDNFVGARTLKSVVHHFNQICQLTNSDPLDHTTFYHNLKSSLTPWKAQKLWGMLDKRMAFKDYKKQNACHNLRVLIIGGGPCGLRMAIECALLGCKVVVVEKRESFSRNNVLHLWPFVIQDLKDLGAKLFYPKFCAGAIDHISIRQLQCMCLKVALILGVEMQEGVSFCGLKSPYDNENTMGWSADFKPDNHFLNGYEFDVLIGADGKRNTNFLFEVPGFPRREMRGKLAIGITANFVNRHSLEEERVQEISGVAFIFNQQFFKDMKLQTGIDLENIVYYKDETHYFVMCAKKLSLIHRGVIKRDYDEVGQLLSNANIDETQLLAYARDAADFATQGGLPKLEFALNHVSQPDVAMFDFTSLFSAENSSRIVERDGKRLIMAIVGDSLHEPFWPTGSGVARGFLSCFDFAWMLRNYCSGKMTPLQVLADREQTYRLLAQSTPDNLHRHFNKYTIDPKTRYMSLDNPLMPVHVQGLFDSDRPEMGDAIDLSVATVKYRGRTQAEAHYVKRVKLIKQLQNALNAHKLRVDNLSECWGNGLLLCALVNRFRPDLIDLAAIKPQYPESNLRTAFGVIQNEFGIDPPIFATSLDVINFDVWIPDRTKMYEYLSNLWQIMRERFAAQIQALNPKDPTKSNSLKRGHEEIRLSKRQYQQKVNKLAPQPIKLPSNENFDQQSDTKMNMDEKIHRFERNGNENDLDRDLDELIGDNFDSEEVEAFLLEWEKEEGKIDEDNRHKDRLQRLQQGFYSKCDANNSVNHKYRTKKPGMIEKLHPERVKTVENMLLGDLPTRIKEMREKKYRQAIKTRKLDKDELEEMENKLEQTGMGSLLFKKHEPVISDQERKIVAVKTADLKAKSLNGFQQDDKFEDFDNKFKKLDSKLATPNKTGTFGVAELKRHHEIQSGGSPQSHSPSMSNSPSQTSLNSPKGPPPPVPTKKPLSPLKPFLPQVRSPVVARCDPGCHMCDGRVYLAERLMVDKLVMHRRCFRCAYCNKQLTVGQGALDRSLESAIYRNRFLCKMHLNISMADKLNKLVKSPPTKAQTPLPPVVIVQPAESAMACIQYDSTEILKALYVRCQKSTNLLMHGVTVPVSPSKPSAPIITPISIAPTTPLTVDSSTSSFNPSFDSLKPPYSSTRNAFVNTPERVEFECSFMDPDQSIDKSSDSEDEIEVEVEEIREGGDKNEGNSTDVSSDQESEDLCDSELDELEETLALNNTISTNDAIRLAHNWRNKKRSRPSQDDLDSDDEDQHKSPSATSPKIA